MKATVAEISKEEGTSINRFVTTAVAEKVSPMKTAEFLPRVVPRPTLKRHGACCDALGDQLRVAKTV